MPQTNRPYGIRPQRRHQVTCTRCPWRALPDMSFFFRQGKKPSVARRCMCWRQYIYVCEGVWYMRTWDNRGRVSWEIGAYITLMQTSIKIVNIQAYFVPGISKIMVGQPQQEGGTFLICACILAFEVSINSKGRLKRTKKKSLHIMLKNNCHPYYIREAFVFFSICTQDSFWNGPKLCSYEVFKNGLISIQQ